MKKIYFSCSIRGGRDDQPVYAEIVELIKQSAEVLSELFVDPKLTAMGHTDWTDRKLFDRDIEWITKSDGVIAEVSNPSLGVGYEIRAAEEIDRPVLALYRKREGSRLSAMIAGNPKIKVIEYEEVGQLQKPIADFIKSL